MHELISITTDPQGGSVVSARDLHAFLEVKSRFNDWIKNRIIKYGFAENEDYLSLTKTLVSGGIETDYALTLDMAKQLSMVENNQKGKEARQYFINAEKAARALAAAPPPPAIASPSEQMMLQLMQQQAQLMAGQQVMLEQLRADVEQIKQTGQRPRPARQSLPTTPTLPGLPLPAARPEGLRQLIHKAVSEYAARWSATNSETYSYLYKRLYETFYINVYVIKRSSRESYLDALERLGYLDKLYSVVRSELDYRDF